MSNESAGGGAAVADARGDAPDGDADAAGLVVGWVVVAVLAGAAPQPAIATVAISPSSARGVVIQSVCGPL